MRTKNEFQEGKGSNENIFGCIFFNQESEILFSKVLEKEGIRYGKEQKRALSHHCDGIIIKISVGHGAVVRSLYRSFFSSCHQLRYKNFFSELR